MHNMHVNQAEESTTFGIYLKAISNQLKTGKATEHTHRPALKDLFESVASGITATNEPKRVECGAPDYVLSKVKTHGPLTIGYVEAKDIGTDLAAIESESRRSSPASENGKQLKRYYPLGNLLLTDYLEFRWYVDGERRMAARLGHVHDGKVIREDGGEAAVRELLQAFLTREPVEISKPKDLAERMARLTHMVRDVIVRAFETNRVSELLQNLHKAFKDNLLPELKIDQFADMFAQTLSYGLFAARIKHTGPNPFVRIGAAAEIPKTNPFLRKLFDAITGIQLNDEPFAGFVDDITQLLAHANIDSVLEDFGKRSHKEDPIVHFYETFLSAYDPTLREKRGVYYTPEPVVSYIVRSVDYLLKERFGCPDGLADMSSVEYEHEVEEDGKKKKIKDHVPRVLVLDPACGTGTFLYSVVDHIRSLYMKRRDAGIWAEFVKKQLLPRLFGFELLMAPYAVAHLKLGMQLEGQDLPEDQRTIWSYDTSTSDRIGIYLTNSLEESEQKIQPKLPFAQYITEEAAGAAEIKCDMPIMVVLGNPPYSGHSANRSYEYVDLGNEDNYISGWKVGEDGKAIPILKKMKDKKLIQQSKIRQPTFIGRLLMDYYINDGKMLSEQGERNPKWLQDDYVKFIRFGQWRIEQTGQGILAFITNHGYLDNPTFRGMRQQLMRAFTDIYILDLHGNKKKKERCPDGSEDQNVFDIQQGVAITIFIKEPSKEGPANVHHYDLWGARETPDKIEGKYPWLLDHNIDDTEWKTLTPSSPDYLFVPQDDLLLSEYATAWKITDIMPVNSVGIVTSRDEFVFDFDESVLHRRIADFANPSISDNELRRRYSYHNEKKLDPLRDKSDWRLADRRKVIKDATKQIDIMARCLYRPFDVRYLFYHDDFIERSRRDVMRHMLSATNMALVTVRRVPPSSICGYFMVTRLIIVNGAIRSDNQSIDCIFPLYLYPDPKTNGNLFTNGLSHHTNLSLEFIADIEKRLSLDILQNGRGDLIKTFGPEDVFNYIYAIFHSHTYRTRYAQFLKNDFPRVPLTSDLDLFCRLVKLGGEMVALHLMESHRLNQFITCYPEPGDHIVEPGHPRYLAPGEPEPGTGAPIERGRVYINKGDPTRGKQGQYFDGVPQDVWEFKVGGYQVCEKWLKDRRGRTLTHDDLVHYQKIVVSLSETIRLMAEIDSAIPAWPIK